MQYESASATARQDIPTGTIHAVIPDSSPREALCDPLITLPYPAGTFQPTNIMSCVPCRERVEGS